MDYETLTNQANLNSAVERQEYNLVSLLKPRIFIDGNKWCVMYGESVQESVCGFGDSPYLAVIDFNKQWDFKLSSKRLEG